MTTLNRADLARAFGNNPKLIAGIETIQRQAGEAAGGQAVQVEATQALQDATVIVLSPNDAFNNERVLAVGSGLRLVDQDGRLTLLLVDPAKVGGAGSLMLLTTGDTVVTLPERGKLLSDDLAGPFADDAAAATGGVDVGKLYLKTGGTVAWRVA